MLLSGRARAGDRHDGRRVRRGEALRAARHRPGRLVAGRPRATPSPTAASTRRVATSPASGCSTSTTGCGVTSRSCPSEWVADSLDAGADVRGIRVPVVAAPEPTTKRLPQDTVLGTRPRRPVHLRHPEPRPRRRAQRHLRQVRRAADRPIRTLFRKYPSDGLVPARARPRPDEWDDAEFLTPIIDALPDQ